MLPALSEQKQTFRKFHISTSGSRGIEPPNSCWKKFEFNKFFPLPPELRRNMDGDIGIAMHKGFQRFIVENNKDTALLEMGINYPHDLNENPESFKSLEACTGTLEHVMQNYSMSGYEIAQIQCPDGVTRPAIEVPYEIIFSGFELPGYDIVRHIGYIDFILYNNQTQLFCVIDMKTHRDNVDDQTAKFANDDQCVPGGLLLQHILGEHLLAFEVAYLSVYIDILEPKMRIYRFQKDQYDIQEWIQRQFLTLRQIRMFMKSGWFPRTGDGNVCFAYRKPCIFFEPCLLRNKELATQWFLEKGGEFSEHDKNFEPWFSFELVMEE